MTKKKIKAWEIKIGNYLWLVSSTQKPTVKESKVRGLRFDKIIIDETIKNGSKILAKNKR
jgi:hypothetical protein